MIRLMLLTLASAFLSGRISQAAETRKSETVNLKRYFETITCEDKEGDCNTKKPTLTNADPVSLKLTPFCEGKEICGISGTMDLELKAEGKRLVYAHIEVFKVDDLYSVAILLTPALGLYGEDIIFRMKKLDEFGEIRIPMKLFKLKMKRTMAAWLVVKK